MKFLPMFPALERALAVPVTELKATVPVNERRMGKAVHVAKGHVLVPIGVFQHPKEGVKPQGNAKEPRHGVEKIFEAIR